MFVVYTSFAISRGHRQWLAIAEYGANWRRGVLWSGAFSLSLTLPVWAIGGFYPKQSAAW